MRAFLVALCIALAGCMASPPATNDDAPGETGPQGESASEGGLAVYGVNGDPFIGNESAAVQVIAYEAPGCSNCRYYHFNGLPEVIANYADTGQIGYHFLQYQIGYQYDITGGIAAECAFREGGTPAYAHIMDLIFERQSEPSLPDYLSDTAATFGLDEETLHACYDGRETEDEVWADIDAGRASRAGSNPGFAVIGPDGVEIVKGRNGPAAAIERALA